MINILQGVSPPIGDYMNSVIEIFANWVKQGGSVHLEQTYNKVISPLLEGSKIPFPHQFSHIVATHALEASSAYKDIASAEMLLRDQVKATAELFKCNAEEGSKLTEGW